MKVRELLTDASKWTQEVSARDGEGMSVGVLDLTATCWCLIGAVYHCYFFEDRVAVLEAIYKELDIHFIAGWNDTHSFTDVKNLIEKLDI